MREPVDPRTDRTRGAGSLVSRFTTVPLGYFTAFVMAALLGLTLADVALRTLFGRGIDGTLEYTETLLVIGVFASLAYAQSTGTHIATSVVTSNVPAPLARTLNAVVGAVGALVLSVTAWAAGERFLQSLATNEYAMGVARVDLWPARLAVAVGLAVYLFEYLRTIHRGPSRVSLIEEGRSEFEHEVKRAEND